MTNQELLYLATRIRQIGYNKSRSAELLENKEEADEAIYLLVAVRLWLAGLNQEVPLEFRKYLRLLELDKGVDYE